MTDLIVPIETKQPDRFPDLRGCEGIILASDYSGEHDGSPFQVLSYLLADSSSVLGPWDESRRYIRQNYLKDDRRFAIKGLGDETKQKALLHFLKAADRIHGLLVCIAIDKSIEPFTAIYGDEQPEIPAGRFKPNVWEKLLRITSFGTILIGGLCDASQKIHWVTDDDEIVANESLQRGASLVCGRMFQTHSQHGPENVQLGIVGQYDDDRLAEDLIAIVDLAGGATAENHAVLGSQRIPATSDLLVPIVERRSTKTALLTAWLSIATSRLRKVSITVRPYEPGQMLLSMGTADMRPDLPSVAAPMWLPLDRGWKNSSRFW